MLDQNWQVMSRIISKTVAKAWIDEKFKDQLIEDAKGTLEKEGITFVSGMIAQVDLSANSFSWRINLQESTINSAVLSVSLPPRPSDITPEELQKYLDCDEQASSCARPC